MNLPPSAPNDDLPAALARYKIELPEAQVEQLGRYCELLWAWNEKLNLTRHTDFERFVGRDLIDTLRLAGHIQSGEEVLDLGTGGGVPGVPLAIVRPDLQVSLCESVGKKARAVDDIVQKLGLPIPVHAERVEAVLEDARFSCVVARAVGPMWKILHWLQEHWLSVGRLLLIKGPRWVEERSEARHRGYPQQIEMRKIDAYPMPGTESESVILCLAPKGHPSHSTK